MKRPRDSQRSKLYRAERAYFGDEMFGEKMTLDECRKALDKILASAWVKRHYGARLGLGVDLLDGRGSRNGRAHSPMFCVPRIHLPKVCRTLPVLCHELAHVVTPNDKTAHGWQFALNYLRLVGHVLGQHRQLGLRESFRKHRVRYKRKRQLSPEQREALRQRMLKLREERAACTTT